MIFLFVSLKGFHENKLAQRLTWPGMALFHSRSDWHFGRLPSTTHPALFLRCLLLPLRQRLLCPSLLFALANKNRLAGEAVETRMKKD